MTVELGARAMADNEKKKGREFYHQIVYNFTASELCHGANY